MGLKMIFLILLIINVNVYGGEKRDILQTQYSMADLESYILDDDSWITYPSYSDRAAWGELSSSLRSKYITQGEEFLDYSWPSIAASTYLEFSRTGSRDGQQKISGERRKALQALVHAELIEGKGRFLDDIINGVFSYCEQTYWGHSAHFYLYRNVDGTHPPVSKPSTVMPDIDDPIIDLGVGEVAADLAWTWYFFKDEFDKVSPVISKRLVKELKDKVIDPYYERDDYWWITGWGRGAVNNWTPWTNYNVIQCILLIEEDREKKLAGIYKSMKSVDLFLNSYEDDGACSEGPAYWGHAGGKMFEYLDLLKKVSGEQINIFDNELVQNMGKYIYRVYIGNGVNFVNFADASANLIPRSGVIYRYGSAIADPEMISFGSFLMNHYKYEETARLGSLNPLMEDLFNIQGWKEVEGDEPLLTDYYFSDLQIAIARDQKGSNEGFYFAAKGGTNAEQHNHNDVGSFILFYNGNPVIVDVGVGTYTRETFSEDRYKIWTMQSLYHNLPVIDGYGQNAGGNFRASHSAYNVTSSQVTFSSDISKAYPNEAMVKSWIRSYTLDRGDKFIISDKYDLKSFSGSSVHYMVALNCSIMT